MRFQNILKEKQSPQGGEYLSGRVCVSQGETEPPRRTILVKDSFLKEKRNPQEGQARRGRAKLMFGGGELGTNGSVLSSIGSW